MGLDKKTCEVSRVYFWLIILGCMNVMSSGSLVLLCVGGLELFRRNFTVELDGKSIAVVLLSCSIFVASCAHYGISECIKSFNYALLYIIGYDGYFHVTDPRKYVEKTAFAIATGFGIELILMYVYNYGREQLTVRSMYSVWTKQPVAVTLLGLLASVVIGYSFYVFFCTKNVRLKVFVLVMLVAGMWFGFETATRTPLIMFCIVYSVMGVIYVFNKRGIKALGAVVFVAFLALFLYLAYRMDMNGIRSALWETPAFQRFGVVGLESRRVEIMKDHFGYMFQYLWGGDNIVRRVGMRAHNVLQEGHDMYGIFTFAALVVIMVQALGNILKLLFRKDKSDMDFLFLCMYLSIMVQMLLEPVFNGYPILIWGFLLIHGMGNAYLRDGQFAEEKLVGQGV